MRVAHESDHITHAIIGGRQAIDFGISDDPAFFQILSSSLYKDPMLAMVRETICNAWDAHIDAGIDTPIEITLNDDHLIIKDFGKGIPDDLIGPIYAVYGASTKKNDGRQTGGFGLGCKSPFSYTDHFEVTSCNNGVKTIYNMSKSSAQVGGKPSVVPIASFPTTETGITVKVPLNPERQNNRLERLIRQVVFNGDIKAKLNGHMLGTLGLDKSDHGMILLRKDALNEIGALHLDSHTIHLRYGNVIYPLEQSQEYKDLYTKVASLVDDHYNCVLVLLAPPDSVSITPSRDSVTMSDITAATITELLSKFLAVFFKNQEMVRKYRNLVNEFVDKAAADKDTHISAKIIDNKRVVPGVDVQVSDPIMSTVDQFAVLEVLLRYSPRSGRKLLLPPKHWLYFMGRYLHQLTEPEVNRGLLHRWFRTARANVKKLSTPTGSRWHRDPQRDTSLATLWWQKNVVAPLVMRLMEVMGSKYNRRALYYFNPTACVHTSYELNIRHVGRVRIQSHTNNLVHLLKPTLVLSHDNVNLPARLDYCENTVSEGTYRKDTYFALQLDKRDKDLEEVIEAIKNIDGIEVIDMTKRTPREELQYQKARERAALAAKKRAATRGFSGIVKKPKAGLVRMDTILVPDSTRIDTVLYSTTTDPEKLTKPEFVALISTAKDRTHALYDIPDRKLSYNIAKLFGKMGAVTNKSDVHERYIKEKKVMDVRDYVMDKVLEAVQNSPTLAAYHTTSKQKVTQYINNMHKVDWEQARKLSRLIPLMYNYPELAALIPGHTPLSDEDQMVVALWENMSCFIPHGRYAEYQTIRQKMDAVPLNPQLVSWINDLMENEFVGLIDTSELEETIRKARKDPAMLAKTVTFITTILS